MGGFLKDFFEEVAIELNCEKRVRFYRSGGDGGEQRMGGGNTIHSMVQPTVPLGESVPVCRAAMANKAGGKPGAKLRKALNANARSF